MDSTKSIVPLYRWLIDVKGYTDFEAEITVLMYDGGFDLPAVARKDVMEYTKEFIRVFR